MKKLILMMSLVVGLTAQLMAQAAYPCDITSPGIELRSTSGAPIPNISHNGFGIARFLITNQGVGMNNGDACAYPAGKVKVSLVFTPSTYASYFFKYNGPPSFATAKYSWTYDVSADILRGTNTAPIQNDFSGAEIMEVPIAGIAAGTTLLPVTMQVVNAVSGDNPNNNAFDMPVTVLAAGGPLPITLSEFDGNAENCSTNVRWITSSETNLNKFEIEVSSDGNIFTSAGVVKPSASNTSGSYQFNWKQGNGKAYYRLKIIDNNGSFTYSKIIPIASNCNEKKFVKVFPNPVIANQLLKVNITGYDASIKGDLYSATGQFVKSFVLKNGTNELTVENLSQGFYTLKVSENGNQTEVIKLSILR